MDRCGIARFTEFMAMTTAGRRDTYTAGRPRQPTQDELHDSDLVRVQSRWDDWRTALVRPGDLTDVHWRWAAGAPRPLIHAYVSCTQLAAGELPHDCEAISRPHRLLVCLLKSHASTRVFEYFSHRAGIGSAPEVGAAAFAAPAPVGTLEAGSVPAATSDPGDSFTKLLKHVDEPTDDGLSHRPYGLEIR